MNNNNLINLKNRTPEERKEIASLGGKASAENRRKRKLLKEALIDVMNMPTKEGELSDLDDISHANKKNFTVIEKIAINLCNRAMKGDDKALETILSILGEKNDRKDDIF